jgi:hypothetical protein
MSIEARRATRYDVDISAEVYTGDAMYAAATRDLSDSGVGLDVPVELSEGSTIGVSLFLVTDGIEDPDAEPLNIKAKVIWSSPRDDYGFSSGLRFDHDDESKSAIHLFLSQL